MTLHADLHGNQGTGFADPILSSQAVFRQVMNALARPGSIHTIPDAVSVLSGITPAAAAIALTLFDHDTPVWLDRNFKENAEIAAWLRFQTGAPLTPDASASAFALFHSGAELPNFETLAQGSPEYPDRSTTLIVQLNTLTEGPELLLEGPGIRETSLMRADSLPHDFAERMNANRAQFPRGVDLLLVCGTQLVALPRSTHVAARET